MSFTDDFFKALKKKEKQTDNIKVTSPFSGGSSINRLSSSNSDNDDIAPVRQSSGSDDFTSDFFEELQRIEEEKEEEERKKEAERRKQEFTKSIGWDKSDSREQTSPGTSTGLNYHFDTSDPNIAVPKASTQEERTWFKGSSPFDDGYDFGDITKAILGTATDLSEELGEGVMEMGENAVDAVAYIAGLVGDKPLVGGGVSQAIRMFNTQDEISDFIQKDLYDSEKIIKSAGAFAPWLLNVMGTDTENSSVLGEKSESLANSAGQFAGQMGLQAVGVPWFVTSGVTSFGSEAENALKQGATYEEAGLSAAITAGSEILTEKLFGGSGLGEKGLINTSGLTKGISNKLVKTMADFGIDLASEGGEEVVSQFASNLGSALYKEENLKEILFSEEAIDSYIESFVGGMAISGGANSVKVSQSIKTGTDYRTGLTADEQSVVNKEVKDRIAEREKDGNKLTRKEKAAIEQAVMNDLEKGIISTDTIEEVLGGETYKSYNDTVTREDALKQEYEELGNLKESDMTAIQKKRFNELDQQLAEMQKTDTRSQLKTKLSEEVSGMVKGSRLSESYNQKALRGQAFDADLSQYDEKQRVIVQSAIDSGILNNTRRTHELVDMVAKLSADKGVLFDFTNNEKLKESGFAIDGKTVNGFIKDGKITINTQSSKYINSVVGHEITHVLKGTVLFDKLQNAVFEYARSKGEYDSRLRAVTELYKKHDPKADPKEELTADLVGDYLFTDSDFINRLSTEHRNVFQKIYDEIKYLYKVATAGSKEARQLEQVKKAFDRAYKANAKGSIDTKYSLSETSDGRLVAVVDNDILSNIDTNLWDDAKKAEAKKAAAEALRKFSDGVVVDGITRKVNRVSRREYTRSEYTESLYNNAPDVFADKMRAADVADDVVVAATNWIRDGGLKHQRNDNFVDFDHGETLILSGNSKYIAEVVVGITNNGEAVLYDIVDITPTTFDIKKDEPPTTATTQNAIGDIQGDSSADNVSQEAPVVKGRFSLSADSEGKQLTPQQKEFFKDSKAVDENGNLAVLYHGTKNGGFTVFDPSVSDDESALFFTNDPATASTYAADSLAEVTDTPDLVPIPKAKPKALRPFERNATKGKGKSGAYKVYLNLTNPLVVEANGANWNNIPFNGTNPVSVTATVSGDTVTASIERAGTDSPQTVTFTKADIENGNFQAYFASEFNDRMAGFIQNRAEQQIKKGDGQYPLRSFGWDADNKKAATYGTRSIAQLAKEQGYDGVIFKSLYDSNLSNDRSGKAPDIYIAFNSNQVKDVNNTEPTADKDIRYSLSEYTDEEKKAHNKAVVDHFGTTYRWAETGYVLLDGSKLDLSGKHEGAPGGYRTVDHRDIVDALGSDYGDDTYSGSLVQFMSEGNIRISPESNGINLSVKPNKAQEMALSSFISNARGEVMLDIDDFNGYTVVSIEYPWGTHANKVLNDIRAWFENGTKPEVPNISRFRSLSNPGDTPKRYGNYAVSGKDIALETAPEAVEQPVQEEIAPAEDVAPVQETAQETAVPVQEQAAQNPAIPPELDTLYSELDSLQERYADVERRLLEATELGEFGDTFQQMSDEWATLKDQIAAKQKQLDSVLDNFAPMTEEDATFEADRLASLNDTDAPPEMEAPYPGEPQEAADPFAQRDMVEVGKRNVKAYMYENPEVKPFFQEAAGAMLGDLYNSTKGEKWYNDEVYYNTGGEKGWYGVTRQTTDDIADLLDNWHYTYAEIEKGLNAIIEDNGAENNAVSKRIEFLLDNRLRNGYKDVYGEPMPANQDYINLLSEKQINEYSDEAFNAFMQTADRYAPPVEEDIAPVTSNIPVTADVLSDTPKGVIKGQQTLDTKDHITGQNSLPLSTDDIAPVAEVHTSKGGEVKGQQAIYQDAIKNESAKMAEIMVDEPKATKKKSSIWDMVKENVLDNGMVFESLAKKTKNQALDDKWNFMRYSEGRAQQLIGNGTDGIKSLNSIQEEVSKTGKTKQFYEYLYHLHNVDRMTLEERFKDTQNKAVFGDHVTAQISQETAAQLEAANPEFKKLSEEVYAYNNYLRQLLVDGDVISQETADLWAEMYPHYVPIRRAGDFGLDINVPLDTGKTGVNAPVKRATGGNSDILPLFDTMAQRTIQTYKAIGRNRFGVELKNTLGTTIAKDAETVDGLIDSIDTQDGLLQEGKNGRNPTFTVFENGERVTFEITEEMYNALKPKSEAMAYTNTVLNKASNLHRGVLTEYNLWFAMNNAIKDAQDVLLNSKHPAQTYKNIPKAIKELSTKGKWYAEYMANGGEQNTYFDGETNTFQPGNKVVENVKKYTGLGAISAANNFVERVPRLAEYIASREAGRTVEGAMLDAARVTTNFAAGGKLTKLLNRNGVTFLNASVQGAVQQVRNVRDAKMNGLRGWAALATKYAVAGLPALLLNHLMWDDDEDYAELSDYVKDNYYIVGKYGDGKFVRIPKGRAISVIQNAFEQISNAITGNDEVDLKRFTDLVINNLAPNSPVDNNVVAPLIQAVNNETWFGDELVPQRLQDLPAAEQYDETTDALSRWLGEKVNISPMKLNYLLDQYTGIVGDTLLPMLTPEAERGDNSVAGNVVAPFVDKFTTDSVMKNQNVSDFYDKMDELTTNAKSSKATDEDVLSYKYFNSVNADLSELYQQKREIQNGNLSDEEKYEQAREIQQQIVDLAKNGLNSYGNVSISGDYATVGDRYFKRNDEGEWGKLSEEQVAKYKATSAAGDSPYATDGDNQWRWYQKDGETEGEWRKITDKELEKQEKVTGGLGISPEEYWSNKDEYDFAYESPEKYTVSKAIGGYDAYRTYSSELYDIKADKDEYGKSISGSRKEKVIDYINNLDADYGEKIILLKSEYPADDTYNYDIVDYLNSRDDISYSEMVTILKELGFTVDSAGNVYWD